MTRLHARSIDTFHMNKKVLGIIVAAAGRLGWDLFRRLSIRNNRGIAKGKQIVILGGGFAGVEASRELERLLPEPDNGEIVLVNKTAHLLFTPMLTEAAGGDIQPHHIIVSLASYTRRTRILIGDVKEIDLEKRTAYIGGQKPETLTADHLVICLGASSNFHHVPGVEQSAIEMKTLADANRLRLGALAAVKSAAHEQDPGIRSALLTFLVAGGGYTGVETIAGLNELVREAAGAEGIAESEIQVVLAEPLGRLMSEVTEDLAAYAQKQLEVAGIRVLLNTGVKNAQGDTVELTSGEKIRTRTFVWTAGVQANEVVARLPAPKGKSKGLKVSGTLALEEFGGIWALGDSAEVPRPDGKGTYAATAQNALREGKLVARNIVRSLRGLPLKPFSYTPIGQLSLVGRRRGVAEVYGMKFSGFTAYALWKLVYFAKLPSVTQRLRVLSDWILDAVLGPVDKLHYIAEAPQEKHDTVSA